MNQIEQRLMTSVGRQFIEFTMEKEGLIETVNKLEGIGQQLMKQVHELSCKLSQHEDVDGYKDGKAVQQGDQEETVAPKKRRRKSKPRPETEEEPTTK